jgi:hypothetical protein
MTLPSQVGATTLHSGHRWHGNTPHATPGMPPHDSTSPSNSAEPIRSMVEPSSTAAS